MLCRIEMKSTIKIAVCRRLNKKQCVSYDHKKVMLQCLTTEPLWENDIRVAFAFVTIFLHLMYCWFGMRKIKIHSSKWSSYTRQVGSSKHWAAAIIIFLYMHVCKHKSKIFVIYSTNYYIPIVNPRRLNTQALDVNILWVHAWLWALRTNLHQWTVEYGRSW